MALTNRTLIIFKYLWETTDESHPVSLADISAHLSQYGITADPRTLRKDIEQLVEFGVDIVKDRRVQNLYHVATRHFEAPEVKLLIDAVQSARFITPGKSKELVNRLTAFVAPGDAVLLKRHLYIDSRSKATNETVCLLSKLQSKEHIEIEVKMDELDLTAAEKKATYEEIKTYVLEHTGLKVSSLYIAQVKQKCGIIERENYNKPKSENAKQLQCPPEKEKAIKEALHHFGMIL